MSDGSLAHSSNRKQRTFLLTDVCAVLEIGNSRDTASRLYADEKDVAHIDIPGGQQEMTIVSESGLRCAIACKNAAGESVWRKLTPEDLAGD
jgi:prophage antirepressor-like protein